MDKAGKEVGVDFVGGFSARWCTRAPRPPTGSSWTPFRTRCPSPSSVCSSVNVGSTRAGINMDAVYRMAQVVRATAEATADRQCIGAGKLVVFCNAVEDNPFMAGAFHGSGEADAVVNVGVSGPGVVRAVLADLPKDADLTSAWPRPSRPPRSRSRGRASSWRARRQRPAGRGAGHPGPVAGADAGRGRLGGRDPGGHRRGHLRRAGNHGGARPAERRREEGRRHGVVVGRRAFGRVHSRVGGCRHDPRRRSRVRSRWRSWRP